MSSPAFTTIASWDYRETGTSAQGLSPSRIPSEVLPTALTPGVPEEEVLERIQAALRQATEQWEISASDQQRAQHKKVADALQEFAAQRATYFRRVEGEIVQLTLAIARKILRREASVDPMLLCGLVRIALDDICAEGAVKLRVAPQEIPAWERSRALLFPALALDVIADASLEIGDAVVETQAGKANLGFDAQLKQVEQGFLDLLAQRPETP